MKPALLLIESSAEFPSVALGCLESHGLVWESVYRVQQSHSEQLPLLVEQALAKANELGYSLKAIAVNEGPGSYTGLRIGSSLAKSLAYAWKIPLMGVSGLKALALATAKELGSEWSQGSVIWSLMDARRLEVYALSLTYPDQVSELRPYVLDQEPLPDVGTRVWAVGNGAFKVAETISALSVELTAGVMLSEALDKYSQQSFVDVAYFEPNYVKGFQPGVNKKYRL
jgi:tRNA threonylcarbamoyladenosine biosynthesis protein TsaB